MANKKAKKLDMNEDHNEETSIANLDKFKCDTNARYSKSWNDELIANLCEQFSLVNGALKRIEEKLTDRVNEASQTAAAAEAKADKNAITKCELRAEMSQLKSECEYLCYYTDQLFVLLY